MATATSIQGFGGRKELGRSWLDRGRLWFAAHARGVSCSRVARLRSRALLVRSPYALILRSAALALRRVSASVFCRALRAGRALRSFRGTAPGRSIAIGRRGSSRASPATA